MSELTALVVANSTDADSGYVGERLVERGYTLRIVLRDRGETPADLDGVDLVLLLGSDWSVHSPVDSEALAAECELVRTASETGVPVLGLCYGAQVLAHAFGGRVSLAEQPEVGFIRVTSDDEGLVPSGAWPQFHLDVVDAPPDAEVIAHNACGTQAFLLPGILGVQFHPELRPEILDDWSRRFPELLVDAGVDRETLVAESREREPTARAAAHALVDAFLDRVAKSSRSNSTSSPLR
jgi:GMP synthase-like glutamine amidotransferase